ncbi:peptide-methionine (S)-S-oxide reductase MsrA [Saccharothrix isguenensis]
MAWFGRDKSQMVAQVDALPGRNEPLAVPDRHAVFTDRGIKPPFPEGSETAVFGMGCFWGVERIFWQIEGVRTTAVGYAGGHTPNPTYEEVCSGLTGHAEVVLVVFDPAVVSFEDLMRVFWQGHDPTQGMRQGNDAGTQYRSAVYWTSDAQRQVAEASRKVYQEALNDARVGEITTEIAPLRDFYYAEEYHQQYLSDTKNPNGYCGVAGTGVSCPIGLGIDGG